MTKKTNPNIFIQSIVRSTIEETIRTISIAEGLTAPRSNVGWKKITEDSSLKESLRILANILMESTETTSKNNANIKKQLNDLETIKREITQIATSINQENKISNKALEEGLQQKEMQINALTESLQENIQNSEKKESELNNIINNITNELSTLRSTLNDIKNNETKLKLKQTIKDDQINELQTSLQEHIQASEGKESELIRLKENITTLKRNESKLMLTLKSKDNQIKTLEQDKLDQNNATIKLQSKLNLTIEELNLTIEELTKRKTEIQLSNRYADQTTIGYIEHFTSIGSTEGHNVKKLDLRTIRYEIKKPIILIGRGDFCDIIIQSLEISIAHSLLLYIPEHQMFLLYDLDSRNGTFFGKNKVNRPYELKYGDTFTIANGERFTLSDN